MNRNGRRARGKNVSFWNSCQFGAACILPKLLKTGSGGIGPTRASDRCVDVVTASNPQPFITSANSLGQRSALDSGSSALPSATDNSAFPGLLGLLLEDFQIGLDQSDGEARSGHQLQGRKSNSNEPEDRKKRDEEINDNDTAEISAVVPIPIQVPTQPWVFAFGLPITGIIDGPGTADTPTNVNTRARSYSPVETSLELLARNVLDFSSSTPEDLTLKSPGGQGNTLEIASSIAFGARLTADTAQSTNPAGSAAQNLPVQLPSAGSVPAQQDTSIQDTSSSLPPVSFRSAAHTSYVRLPVEEKTTESDAQSAPKDIQAGVHSTVPSLAASTPQAARTETPLQTKAEPSKAATEMSIPQQSPRSEPPQGISLRLGNHDTANVDVQVIERYGKVHVTVRSNDADLGSSLRQNLGDLVSNLENKGFKAETWAPADRPSVVSTDTGNNTNGRNSSHSESSGKGPDHGGGGNGGQRNQQQRRPFWTHEFENNLDA